ncbi:MAG: hypothetical protein ABIE14_03565 [Patescibacteria group bacterium]
MGIKELPGESFIRGLNQWHLRHKNRKLVETASVNPDRMTASAINDKEMSFHEKMRLIREKQEKHR